MFRPTARAAAHLFTLLTAGAVMFQLALAGGAPWGSFAWGGRFPGVLPGPMRMASVGSALLLSLLIRVVRSRAGFRGAGAAMSARMPARLVVMFCLLSVAANAATPSAGERRIWLPVTLGLLVTSVIVATARQEGPDAKP